MYRIIVSSARRIEHEDSKSWKSPEWARIWETQNGRLAKRRVRELRCHNHTVILLKVIKGVAKVVHVKA